MNFITNYKYVHACLYFLTEINYVKLISILNERTVGLTISGGEKVIVVTVLFWILNPFGSKSKGKFSSRSYFIQLKTVLKSISSEYTNTSLATTERCTEQNSAT